MVGRWCILFLYSYLVYLFLKYFSYFTSLKLTFLIFLFRYCRIGHHT